MAYKLMKRIIARDVKNGTLNRAATMDKLDAFLAADRLTAAMAKTRTACSTTTSSRCS